MRWDRKGVWVEGMKLKKGSGTYKKVFAVVFTEAARPGFPQSLRMWDASVENRILKLPTRKTTKPDRHVALWYLQCPIPGQSYTRRLDHILI